MLALEFKGKIHVVLTLVFCQGEWWCLRALLMVDQRQGLSPGPLLICFFMLCFEDFICVVEDNLGFCELLTLFLQV